MWACEETSPKCPRPQNRPEETAGTYPGGEGRGGARVGLEIGSSVLNMSCYLLCNIEIFPGGSMFI